MARCTICRKEHSETTKMCEECKAKARIQNKRAYEKNRQGRIQKQKEYYDANKETISFRSRTLRRERLEEIRAYEKRLYQKNAEKRREQARNNCHKYRDKRIAYDKKRNHTMERRLESLKRGARIRLKPWELSDDEARHMISSPCFYCGSNEEGTLRGIDRINNTLPYVSHNCKPACTTCNFMKKCLDPITFIKRCRQISLVHCGHGEITDKWRNTKKPFSHMISYYKNKSQNVDIDFARILSQDCHYCGRSTVSKVHTNGIDRRDPKKPYALENCLPCCGECNMAKGKIEYDVFIRHCILVSKRHSEIPDIQVEENLRCLDYVHPRQPSPRPLP